jgi:uncharacterized protein (DUF1800 family)
LIAMLSLTPANPPDFANSRPAKSPVGVGAAGRLLDPDGFVATPDGAVLAGGAVTAGLTAPRDADRLGCAVPESSEQPATASASSAASAAGRALAKIMRTPVDEGRTMPASVSLQARVSAVPAPGAMVFCPGPREPRPNPPLTKPLPGRSTVGPMTDRRVVSHVLRRLTFGPTAAEADAAERAGLGATVERVLAPAPLPGLPDLGPDPFAAPAGGADRRTARKQSREQVAEALWWWIDRLAATGGTAAEKLTFFWHGHWATSVQKVRSAALMLGQQQTFRRYGAGSTGPLVRAMLRDPALIVWLDGRRNTRRAPNENLAREVMELFTLGVGRYTEDDVKAAARVLTGWRVDRAAGVARLDPRRHDASAVTLLGRTGTFDVDAFADLLVQHPAHVPFLAGRVWRRYAADGPPPAAVATALAGAGNDVSAMLRVLSLDAAFPATAGHLVKQPVEWMIGALRQLGADPAGLADRHRSQVLAGLRALGQVPLRPPSVGGWPADQAWLTTASAQARLRAGQALAALAPAAVQELSEAAAGDRLDALARLLVVDAWTGRTAAALRPALGDPRRLLALALATPEYTVH